MHRIFPLKLDLVWFTLSNQKNIVFSKNTSTSRHNEKKSHRFWLFSISRNETQLFRTKDEGILIQRTLIADTATPLYSYCICIIVCSCPCVRERKQSHTLLYTVYKIFPFFLGISGACMYVAANKSVSLFKLTNMCFFLFHTVCALEEVSRRMIERDTYSLLVWSVNRFHPCVVHCEKNSCSFHKEMMQHFYTYLNGVFSSFIQL